MAKKEQTGMVSFDPDDHTAGGYLDDRDCTVIQSRIVEYDFEGKTEDGKPQCCWMVQFRPDEGDADGEDDRTEYYRLGSLEKFTPNAEGTQAVAVKSGARLNTKSKASLFSRSLKAAGLTIAADVTVLDGVRVHVNLLALPEFKGRDGKMVKDATYTAVTGILDDEAPAAASGGKKAKPKAKAKAKAKAAAEPDSDVEDQASAAILELLSTKGGTVNKPAIPTYLFKAIKDGKTRNTAIALAAKDEWLGDEDRPWAYDDGVLSIGE